MTNWRKQLEEISGYGKELLGVPGSVVHILIDEIEYLRNEVEELRAESSFNFEQYQDCGNELYKLGIERDSLAEQLKAYKLYANRYLWLREADQTDFLKMSHYAFCSLDAAIDSAMQEKKP